MKGYIQLHRKLIDWEWYSNLPVRVTFIHFLLFANWEEKNWQGMTIKRGQLIIGRKKAAKDIGISEQQLRTSITKLKSTNEITTKSTNKYTVITVVKYDNYQDVKTKSTNEITINSTNEQPSINHQSTTTNNYNNINNYKEYNNTLLSEIKISDFDDRFQKYIKTAISFQKLFIKNLIEKKSPCSDQKKATFGKYVQEIRLMIEKDEITDDQFRTAYDFLDSLPGDFWKTNILSIKKLRQQISVLVAKANSTKNGNKVTPVKKISIK